MLLSYLGEEIFPFPFEEAVFLPGPTKAQPLRALEAPTRFMAVPGFVSADVLADSILVAEQDWGSELEWRVTLALRRTDTLVHDDSGHDVVQLYGLNPCVLEQQ